MRRCEYCGSELPGHAHFCGNCGRVVSDATETPTEASDIVEVNQDSPDIATVISDPSQSFVVTMWAERERGEDDSTIGTAWLEQGMSEEDLAADENQTLGPDLLLPGMMAGGIQGIGGNVPVVYGTPEASGVPTVRGTPPGVSGPPHVMQNPQTPPLHLAARAPEIHTPPHNPAGRVQTPQHLHQVNIPHSPQPVQPIQPPYRHEPQPAPHPYGHPHPHLHVHERTDRISHHVEAHRHHTPGRTPVSRVLSSSRKLIVGTTTKWAIVVVTAIVVAVSSGIFAVVAFNPSATLFLSGSSSVSAGGVLTLNGRGFSPGANIILTLDHGLPLTSVENSLANKQSTRMPEGAGFAATSLLLNAGQAEQAASSNAAGTTIQASSGGTFSAKIAVQQSWSLGQHVLSAKEANGTRSAELTFNVVATPARLVVNPLMLDFGALQANSKVFLSIVIANAGTQRLNWKADTGGTKWLKVLGGSGAIEPRGPEEFSYVMADTSHLSLGSYSATITINSNGGKQQVAVKLSVIPAAASQAKLNVNPPTLDFGQVPVNQQATMGITLSNAGTQALNWKADSGGTNWLSLNANAGSINAGQQPQLIQVTVDATGLATGKQSAVLQFNSNGGSAQVMIMVDVTTATLPRAPILTGSPSGFNVPGDGNCTYDVNAGWTCSASLSSYKSAQASLAWKASSTGVNGVSFSPQSGTLSPGQTAKVTISIPNTVCPGGADFTFTGPGNTIDILWNCAGSTLAVSPGSFNANTDCTFSNGWTCFATLTSPQNAQGYLNWSASGSGIKGISFSPANGSLAPGQSEQVTISVPSAACPATASLSFLGLKTNTVAVPWSCVAPTLVISKSTFNANTDCVFNNGWTCNETLSLGSNEPGDPNLSWNAASNGISGIRFSPSSGTLAAGQSTQVTITVPNTACPASASLSFAGQNSNTPVASWSCAQVNLQASKKSFDGNTDCTYDSTNGWTCTETLSLSSNNQGDPSLNWSATGSGIKGISFSPSSGTLAAGQTTQVTITVPPTNCPASASLSFAAQNSNTVAVAWSCSAVTLQVSTTDIHADSDCTYDSTNGWTCTETLSLSSSNPGDPSLNWSTSSSGIKGISFSPVSGTLAAGQTTQVTITIPNTSCPNHATLTFTTPSNTVNVKWGCAGQKLSASPGSFNANTDCTLSGNSTWACLATVSSSSSAQGDLNWSASGSGISGITFSPQSGTLSPGQSTTVTITVPTSCPASAMLTFTGPANMVTIPWSCTAPTLAVNQTSFHVPDNNCSYSAGQGWSCNTTLVNQDSEQSLNWSATASGVSGITETPSSGTLPPSQSATVSIFVPDTTCPASATITFSGPANSVNVTWDCPTPSLTIDLTSFSNTSCTQISDGSWTCSEILSLAQGAQGNLSWSASSSLSGVSFNPPGGTLLASSPSLAVSINIPASDCTSGSFTFSGQGKGANSATASWSCSAPSLMLSVSPGSFNANNCTNDGSAWSCVATVSSSSSNTGNLNWSATSNMPSAVGFTPSNGSLSPGQSAQVTATLPASCPTSVTFQYIGPANTVNVPFSC